MAPPEVRLVRARAGLVAGLLLIVLLTPVAVASGISGTADAYRATHGLGTEASSPSASRATSDAPGPRGTAAGTARSRRTTAASSWTRSCSTTPSGRDAGTTRLPR